MGNMARKRELTLEELAIFENEMLKRSKKGEVAWALWTFLSFFGAHRFYTEDFGYASAMLTTTFIPLVGIIYMMFIGDQSLLSSFLFRIFLIFLGGSVIWSWIDAFFLSKRVIAINDTIEEAIINEIKGKF